jgi:hypothetical protein
MSEARRNQYDRHHCLEQGQRAEDQFITLIQQRGWQVQRASEYADKHEHWDCVIEKPPRRFKVDVKAMKRIRRQDVTVQDQWLWVELHGVRPSDHGWLYAGQADLLAIEQQTHFLLLKRLDLIDFVGSIRGSSETRLCSLRIKRVIVFILARPCRSIDFDRN